VETEQRDQVARPRRTRKVELLLVGLSAPTLALLYYVVDRGGALISARGNTETVLAQCRSEHAVLDTNLRALLTEERERIESVEARSEKAAAEMKIDIRDLRIQILQIVQRRR
jgi:hypothetical protein